MIGGPSGPATLGVALAACLGAAGALYAQDRFRPRMEEASPLLYVRSSALADRLFLSFDAVAADVYWMRTIQHYGASRRRGDSTFPLLQPLLDLTTTLDPRFNIVYRYGAILLALEPPDGPGRSDMAIQLLEKGLLANPDRWQYAHDIGFVH
jgi:hypothetical protein